MSAWRPDDETGLVLWLDAGEGVTLGTSPDVAAWADQSGEGNDAAQSTAASRPHFQASDSSLGNRPSILFDGTDDWMDLTGWTGAASAWTVLMAIAPTNASPTTEYLIDAETGPITLAHGSDVAGTWGFYAGTAWQRVGAAASGGQLLTWVLDANLKACYRNGLVTVHAPATWTNATVGGDVALGADHGAASGHCFAGAIAEVLVYSNALGRIAREKAESYLASKYGLTALLPPGHPGTSQALPVGDWGTSGGPGWQTMIESIASGREVRAALESQSRGRFSAQYTVQTMAQLKALQAWFLAHRGQWRSFRYKDWTDYSAAGETIGGSGTSRQLTKTYTSGSVSHIRTIRRPVPGTVILYDGGTPIAGSAYQIDCATGEIELDGAPAGALTADFEFDCLVRFDSDELPISLDAYQIGSVQAIPLQEVEA